VNATLSSRLALETRALHRSAERAGFMRRMVRRRFDRRDYCRMLRGLYPIYEAIEGALERHGDHPVVAGFPLPAGLERGPRIADDLTALWGTDWRDALPVPDPATAYAGHIRGVEDADPALVLAHAYVRYFGDLSGGRILAHVVAETLELTGDRGLAFYRFESLPRPEALKDAMRRALDALPLDDAGRDAFVEEARTGFRHHVHLFEALDPDPGARAPDAGPQLPPPDPSSARSGSARQ
jgi:heme oxygenase